MTWLAGCSIWTPGVCFKIFFVKSYFEVIAELRDCAIIITSGTKLDGKSEVRLNKR